MPWNDAQSESTQERSSGRRPVGPIAGLVVGLAVIVLLLVGLEGRGGPPQPGEPVPVFSLERLGVGGWRPDLSQIAVDELLGQVVVVNFWASWCAPCRAEASDLEATWRAYRDRGVVFVGIAYRDTVPKAEQHMSEFGVTYPNVQDPSGRIARAYGVTGVPETFVVGSDGRLVWHFPGEVTQAVLAVVIDPLLEQ